MITRREVVRLALEHRAPPWVPWQFGFTHEASQRLLTHFGPVDLEEAIGNHQLWLGHAERFADQSDGRHRDRWGVVWNRSVDVDIGVVEGQVLPEPSLTGLRLPQPDDADLFAGVEEAIARSPDRFRVFHIGFSLYERAWTLRGMEALLTDMVEYPDFVDALLDAICDWNIAILQRALARFDLDAISFGDDWGSQRGMQMGPKRWRRFILPRLTRMYGRSACRRSLPAHPFLRRRGRDLPRAGGRWPVLFQSVPTRSHGRPGPVRDLARTPGLPRRPQYPAHPALRQPRRGRCRDLPPDRHGPERLLHPLPRPRSGGRRAAGEHARRPGGGPGPGGLALALRVHQSHRGHRPPDTHRSDPSKTPDGRYQAETGTTSMADLRRMRLEAACELLLTSDAPLRCIAEATGFCDPQHLTRAFKAAYGRTPSSLLG